jgi:hypothetical protein
MPTPPRPLDRSFLEHRAQLLDVAAFLDRCDRAGEDRVDFRMRALMGAIEILRDGQPERARRMLELWSDPSTEPIEKAPGKGAVGAWSGVAEAGR